jgi:hypothetical protein
LELGRGGEIGGRTLAFLLTCIAATRLRLDAGGIGVVAEV